MRALIFRGIGSLYALLLEITFMPFLVFFMLAEKRQVWHGTLQLFPRRAARWSRRRSKTCATCCGTTSPA